MEKALERACVGLQVGWSGISGNHQGGANNNSQVNGDLDMTSTCCLCRGQLIKGTMASASSVTGGLSKETAASASIFVLKKAASSALALIPDNLAPPHKSLVSFELLPQGWSS